VNRRNAARYIAPLLFLAAVTIAVLLVRAGMDEAARRQKPAGGAVTPTATTPSKTASERFYRIRPGDTLGVVAPRFGLTEAELIGLNPGIEPTALRIGQKIRVR